MKSIICYISGKNIGNGHLIRSNEIKRELEIGKIKASLIKINRDNDYNDIIKKYGNKKNILIMDTKETGSGFINELKKHFSKVAGFENTDKRREHLDIIIDSNKYYKTSDKSKYLYGPDYVVIRKEILDLKNTMSKKKTRRLKSVLLAPGGYGNKEWLNRSINFIKKIDCNLDVYISGSIESVDTGYNKVDNKSYIEVLNKIDAVVCAGGITMFEMIYLRKKFVVNPINNEQLKNIRKIKRYAPYIKSIYDKNVVYYLKRDKIYNSKIIDGLGTKRIVARLKD